MIIFKEKYCFIKDDITLNKQETTDLKDNFKDFCHVCNEEGHDELNCAMLHLSINKRMLVSKINYSNP